MARTTSATFLFHLFIIVLLATGAQTDGGEFTLPLLGRRRFPPPAPMPSNPCDPPCAQTDGTLPVLHNDRVTPPTVHGAQTDGSEFTLPLLGRMRFPPPAPKGSDPPCYGCAQTDGSKLTILGRKHMPPSTPVVAPIPGGPRVQADGGEFTLPILGRGGPALSPPAHAPPGPDLPKVINIGPCLRSHNAGGTHTFCLKQCMNIGYVGGHCDILPDGLPGGCSCQNHI